MAAIIPSATGGTGTTGGSSTMTVWRTSSTTSDSAFPPMDFPDWAGEGCYVIDEEDNDWFVVGQFYIGEILMLELENEDGEEIELKLKEVGPAW